MNLPMILVEVGGNTACFDILPDDEVEVFLNTDKGELEFLYKGDTKRSFSVSVREMLNKTFKVKIKWAP